MQCPGFLDFHIASPRFLHKAHLPVLLSLLLLRTDTQTLQRAVVDGYLLFVCVKQLLVISVFELPGGLRSG